MSMDPEFAKDLLHSTILEVYELESMNIIYSNRWRDKDGAFRNEEVEDAFFVELVGQNRRKIEGVITDVDGLLKMYPEFVVLPLVRSLGSLTVRVIKGSRTMQGAMLAVWQVMKRLESHTSDELQVANGWAVIRSAWTIMLDLQMDGQSRPRPPKHGGKTPPEFL